LQAASCYELAIATLSVVVQWSAHPIRIGRSQVRLLPTVIFFLAPENDYDRSFVTGHVCTSPSCMLFAASFALYFSTAISTFPCAKGSHSFATNRFSISRCKGYHKLSKVTVVV
ncbi:hypothetical protein KCV00_g416, partial [Aureobasidium melanogenum]